MGCSSVVEHTPTCEKSYLSEHTEEKYLSILGETLRMTLPSYSGQFTIAWMEKCQMPISFSTYGHTNPDILWTPSRPGLTWINRSSRPLLHPGLLRNFLHSLNTSPYSAKPLLSLLTTLPICCKSAAGEGTTLYPMWIFLAST